MPPPRGFPFFSRDRSFESARGALVTSRVSRERIKYLPRPDPAGRAVPPRLITNAPVNQSGSDSSRSNAIRFFAVSNNDRELIKRNKPTESKKTSVGKNRNDAPRLALAYLLYARVFSLRFFFIFPSSPPSSSSSSALLARYRAARDSPAPRFPQHPLSSLAAEPVVEKESRDLGRCARGERGAKREREREKERERERDSLDPELKLKLV